MEISDIPKMKNYLEYSDIASDRRGRILNDCINLERFIDDAIASYLCPTDKKKRGHLLRLTLNNGKLGFRAKLYFLDNLLNDLFPNEPHKSEIKQGISSLYSVVEDRNKMAHRATFELDFEKSILEGKTVYHEIGSSAEPYELTEESFDAKRNEIHDCCLFVLSYTHRIIQLQAQATL